MRTGTGVVARGWLGRGLACRRDRVRDPDGDDVGMMSTIAMMVGSDQPGRAGWHLVNSAFYGAVFAEVVPATVGTGAVLGAGAVYGIVRQGHHRSAADHAGRDGDAAVHGQRHHHDEPTTPLYGVTSQACSCRRADAAQLIA
ncbi:hypothetical protein HBB16_09990 [Pseudonocardia sp. MCCB 268]|nr:hypothetical protein [Pseudonocardia cytotoxica]